MLSAVDALRLDENAMRLAAAREAIQQVGLLKAEAEEIIFHMLDPKFNEHHPKAICAGYRKDGDQLSKEELKAIGLRSNAFFSKRAFSDLKIRGLDRPLEAHEVTLLRAWFTFMRWRNVSQTRGQDISDFEDDYRYDVNSRSCPVCVALDGQLTKGDNAHIFPPPKCQCETANYLLKPHIAFLKGLF